MRESLRFFKKYYKNKTLKICLYILFSMLHKASILFIPIFTQKLIDSATSSKNINKLNENGLNFFIIIILFIIFLSLKTYLQNNIEISVVNDIKLSILKKINTMSYTKLINKDIGYFLQRINIDVEKIRNLIVEIYTMLVINIIYICAILVMMIKLNLTMSLILISLVPIFILISKIFLPKIGSLNKKVLEQGEIINSYFEDNINGNYVLRVNNSLDYMKLKIEKALNYLLKLQLRNISYEIVYDFVLVTGIMNIATFLTYWVGGQLVYHNKFSIGTLVAFTLYFSRLWSPIEFFMDFPKRIKISKISLSRINDFLETKEYSCKNSIKLGKFESISIQNVCFSYQNKNILNKINLDVNNGDKIAIIGGNGSGKSTIANILVKLIKPDSGNIYYNTINYNDIAFENIIKKITLIPSDSYLFKMSIGENIAFEENKILDNKLLRQKEIQDLFNNNKIGIDTLVDNKGQNLSGGEKKLIQIARGLNNDSEIYIIDEPLNYVDKIYKKTIINFIKNNYSEKTLIIISHDSSILEVCNKIYNIKDGKLTQKNLAINKEL